jgi:Na+/H+-dicarboxylate symporter
MSLTKKIVTGLALGAAVGVFLGEYAAPFQFAADAFVKLLQMTVLPYVTLSIIKSLGSLSLANARLLGLRGGAVLAGLWGIGLAFAFLIPLTFPHVETAMFFSTSLIEPRPAFDFVGLYIPANPFNSLANNIVPAVVLFSVVVGIALIGVERKERLLDVLDAATEAVSRATRAIVRLTPYGLFAIAAAAAGTLNLEQLGRLQVYLLAYVAIGLLVSLWVLPGLVAALTPIRIGEIFGLTRDALITAFVAGDLFIVLPALIQASQTLLARHAPDADTTRSLPEVLVPVSFNFPHTGKLLSISFVLFAGWFADAALPVADYPRLAVTGLLTFFGSLNAAVPFLLDVFGIPADTFQLFVASGVVNARVGSLVAAVHTLTVALLGACAISGMLRFRRTAVVRYLALTLILTATVVGGMRMLFGNLLRPEYSKDRVLAGMHLLQAPTPATVLLEPADTEPADSRPVLQGIRERGVLRVGYVADGLPYVFFNAKGDLVGLDVDLAHRLASELRVRLEFRPIERERMPERLASGYCDFVIGGTVVTTLRATTMLFSKPYLDETLAFVVPDAAREGFSSWRHLEEQPKLTIAVPDVPYYVDLLRTRLPHATIRLVSSVEEPLKAWDTGVDAYALPAERGSAWTLLYPQFTVTVPKPGFVKIPLAFPIARQDQAFAAFLNTWIDLKTKDGTLQRLYDYWVLGLNAAPPQPRWSVIRSVLHWVE